MSRGTSKLVRTMWHEYLATMSESEKANAVAFLKQMHADSNLCRLGDCIEYVLFVESGGSYVAPMPRGVL